MEIKIEGDMENIMDNKLDNKDFFEVRVFNKYGKMVYNKQSIEKKVLSSISVKNLKKEISKNINGRKKISLAKIDASPDLHNKKKPNKSKISLFIEGRNLNGKTLLSDLVEDLKSEKTYIFCYSKISKKDKKKSKIPFNYPKKEKTEKRDSDKEKEILKKQIQKFGQFYAEFKRVFESYRQWFRQIWRSPLLFEAITLYFIYLIKKKCLFWFIASVYAFCHLRHYFANNNLKINSGSIASDEVKLKDLVSTSKNKKSKIYYFIASLFRMIFIFFTSAVFIGFDERIC